MLQICRKTETESGTGNERVVVLAFPSLDYLLNAKSVPEEIMTGDGGGGGGRGGVGVPGDVEDGASLCHVTSEQSGFRIKMGTRSPVSVAG